MAEGERAVEGDAALSDSDSGPIALRSSGTQQANRAAASLLIDGARSTDGTRPSENPNDAQQRDRQIIDKREQTLTVRIKNANLAARDRHEALYQLYCERTAQSPDDPKARAAFEATAGKQFDHQMEIDAEVKRLSAQLQPRVVNETYTDTAKQVHRFQRVMTPVEPEIYRHMISLKSGLKRDDPKLNQAVSAYRAKAQAHQAQEKAQLSKIRYELDATAIASTPDKVTREVAEAVWHDKAFTTSDPNMKAFEGMRIVDLMFNDETQPHFPPSQRAQWLRRTGSAYYLENDKTREKYKDGAPRSSDLLRHAVVITPEMMNKFLDEVLFEPARYLMSGENRAKLEDTVAADYLKLHPKNLTDLHLSENQERDLVDQSIGTDWKTADGMSLANKNDQAAAISWKTGDAVDKKVKEDEASVATAQQELDAIVAHEKEVDAAARKDWTPRYKEDTGPPPFHDPRHDAAQQKLDEAQGKLEGAKVVRQSFYDQAKDLRFGVKSYDQVMVDINGRLKETIQRRQDKEARLIEAQKAYADQQENYKIVTKTSNPADGGRAADAAMAIMVDDARNKVEAIKHDIADLQKLEGDLGGYITDAKTGRLPAPIFYGTGKGQALFEYATREEKFKTTPERWGLAIWSGVEATGSFLLKVLGGIVWLDEKLFLPNQIMPLLSSDPRLNMASNMASSSIWSAAHKLDEYSAANLAATGGGLDVQILSGLTQAVLLYLPTMGFGSVGAAVGGAIRATELAELIGASVSLGTMGALAGLEDGPGGALKSALPMALLPLGGAAFKSIPAKLAAAFVANYSADVLLSADYGAAVEALRQGKDPIKAALAGVDFTRALAQGLLAVGMEAHGATKPRAKKGGVEPDKPIVETTRVGPDNVPHTEYLRFVPEQGGKGTWKAIDASEVKAAAGGKPTVKLAPMEFDVLRDPTLLKVDPTYAVVESASRAYDAARARRIEFEDNLPREATKRTAEMKARLEQLRLDETQAHDALLVASRSGTEEPTADKTAPTEKPAPTEKTAATDKTAPATRTEDVPKDAVVSGKPGADVHAERNVAPPVLGEGWVVTDIVVPTKEGELIITDIYFGGKKGMLSQVYEAKTGTWRMVSVSFEEGLPRFAGDRTLLNLLGVRQMKLLGVESLQKLQMNNVVNLETLVRIENAVRTKGVEREQALLDSPLVRLVDRDIRRDFPNASKPRLKSSDEIRLGDRIQQLEYGDKSEEGAKKRADLLKRYGLTADDKVLGHFEIEWDVTGAGGGDRTVEPLKVGDDEPVAELAEPKRGPAERPGAADQPFLYPDDKPQLDPKYFREAPGQHLGDGSMADVFAHKERWVVKTLQPGGTFGGLPLELQIKLMSEDANLIGRVAKILADENLGKDVVPRTRALAPVTGGSTEVAQTGRPALVQERVSGGQPLSRYEGEGAAKLEQRAQQMVQAVSRQLGLPLVSEVPSLFEAPTWCVDDNLANFLVMPDGALRWIDPVFPPSAKAIVADPAVLTVK